MSVSLFALGCVVGLLPKDSKESLSALDALKIAQRRLKPEVREALLIISSRRSVSRQAPSVWRFVFQDLSTIDSFRVVSVSSHLTDQSDSLAGFKKEADLCTLIPIDQERILIDSDEALRLSEDVPKEEWTACEMSLVKCPGTHNLVWSISFFEFENSVTASSTVTINGNSGKPQDSPTEG